MPRMGGISGMHRSNGIHRVFTVRRDRVSPARAVGVEGLSQAGSPGQPVVDNDAPHDPRASQPHVRERAGFPLSPPPARSPP
ncbi:hypothetical protein SNOUR_39835 [Streptomyces noursei ATCC 11455]|nr:hypothetical protein SNOUR_39835 [Streptomyces noursei ATCC 11455]